MKCLEHVFTTVTHTQSRPTAKWRFITIYCRSSYWLQFVTPPCIPRPTTRGALQFLQLRKGGTLLRPSVRVWRLALAHRMGQRGHRASSKPGPEDTLLALCTWAITVGRTGRCSQEGMRDTRSRATWLSRATWRSRGSTARPCRPVRNRKRLFYGVWGRLSRDKRRRRPPRRLQTIDATKLNQ